jgi:hypothetical protein
VLGRVAVDEKSNEIPAVQDLPRAFASLVGAVVTIDADAHTQTERRRSSSARALTT